MVKVMVTKVATTMTTVRRRIRVRVMITMKTKVLVLRKSGSRGGTSYLHRREEKKRRNSPTA